MSTASQSEELQRVLAAQLLSERMERALELLKKELVSLHLQAKIARDVDHRILKNQKQFFLREQMHISRRCGCGGQPKDGGREGARGCTAGLDRRKAGKSVPRVPEAANRVNLSC